jgi:hypothetical protein
MGTQNNHNGGLVKHTGSVRFPTQGMTRPQRCFRQWILFLGLCCCDISQNFDHFAVVWTRIRGVGEGVAVTLGLPCVSDLQCQSADPGSKCLDGVCDCAIKNNGSHSCGVRNTGCYKGTFQVSKSEMPSDNWPMIFLFLVLWSSDLWCRVIW